MDSLIGAVPDDWRELRLNEVCDVLTGPSGAQADLTKRGLADVPVVTPGDLRNNRIADDCATGVSREAAGGLSRYRLLPGDIVCVRRGQLGRQGLVGENQQGWLISPACLRLRVREAISAPYLVYYLSHPTVRDWMVRNTSGAVIPTLSTSMLGSLPVVIPPAAVQADVAAVLCALDDKAIVHEQISRTTAALRDAVLPRLLSGEIRY
jgi:type I restriction enzyme, S subunit